MAERPNPKERDPERKRRAVTGATRETAVEAMLDEFPDFMKLSTTFVTGKLFCKVCLQEITANPSRLSEHLQTAKHKTLVESTQKIELLLGKKSPDSARNEAITFLVGNMAGLNICCNAMPKVMSPVNCALMKHVGSFPGRTAVREVYVPRAYEEMMRRVRSFLQGKPYSVLVDESEDMHRKPVWCVLLNAPDGCLLGNVQTPPSGMPNGAETLVKVMKDTIALLALNPVDMQALSTDNAAYCGKAYRLLKAEYPTLLWIRCLAHGLNLVLRAFCSPFEKVDALMADLKTFFCRGFGLRRRINSFEVCFNRSPLVLFDITETRWSEWVKAAKWTSANAEKFATWMIANGSQAAASTRIVSFLSDTHSLGLLHAVCASTSELVDLIVEAQGDPMAFLCGERGNLFVRMDGLRYFFESMQNVDTAEEFIKSTFLTHREEPGGASFQERFDLLEKEEKQEVFVACGQGAIPALEKFEKHIAPTLNALKAAQYIVPEVASGMREVLAAKLVPPPEICSSPQCPGIDASFVNDWKIYVAQELSAFAMLTEEDRPSTTDFWKARAKRLPRLAAFALRVLSLPLGTAAAERAFAKLRDVQTPHRANLGEAYVRMELMLSFNGSELPLQGFH